MAEKAGDGYQRALTGEAWQAAFPDAKGAVASMIDMLNLVRQTPFGREGVKREGSQAGRKLSGKEVEQDVWTRNGFLTHFYSKSRIA